MLESRPVIRTGAQFFPSRGRNSLLGIVAPEGELGRGGGLGDFELITDTGMVQCWVNIVLTNYPIIRNVT